MKVLIKDNKNNTTYKLSPYSDNILFVGPNYINHRGGIGAVLEIYSSHMEPFKFISSYAENPPLHPALYFLKACLKYCKRLVVDRDIKIVHLHSASKGSFYRKSILLIIAKIFHKKVILHLHAGGFRKFYSGSNNWLKSYIRFIIGNTDKLICISDRALDFFRELSPYNNILALDNPIQINTKTDNAITEYPIRILYLSRINKNKGAFDLVELVNTHQEYLRGKIVLEMGGDGETEYMQQLLKKYEIEDIVEFKGWVAGDRKAEMIKNCNVLILPSYFEELPMAILEAMAYGKPIISTDVGGISKVVKQGVNGWMFEPGDKEVLFKILQTIIQNPELLVTYGSNSYDIIDEYSVKKIMEKLDLVYESMMES